MNHNIYIGTAEEWLDSKEYRVKDVYDDNFALDFSMVSVKHRFLTEESVEIPLFVDKNARPQYTYSNDTELPFS